MNIEEYRDFCLSLPGVEEGFPFDSSTLVFKVMNKMFALTDVDNFAFINLKATPEDCIELREKYDGIKPGYHMNKKQWNSVYTDAFIGDELMYKWITDSYDLVVLGLPKKLKEELNELSNNKQ
jgi:predicted DNA-binding protein (MmcQ/YjbR family)